MNMRVLTPSRRRINVGDIFAYQMPDERYRFGRVIRLDVTLGGFPGCILIYLYRPASDHIESPPVLSRDALLIAPVGTNRKPWSKGYFQTIRNEPLQDDDILPRHCFWSGVDRKFYDEQGCPLARRLEPCGFYGVDSYRTIDDAVSDALGIAQSA